MNQDGEQIELRAAKPPPKTNTVTNANKPSRGVGSRKGSGIEPRRKSDSKITTPTMSNEDINTRQTKTFTIPKNINKNAMKGSGRAKSVKGKGLVQGDSERGKTNAKISGIDGDTNNTENVCGSPDAPLHLHGPQRLIAKRAERVAAKEEVAFEKHKNEVMHKEMIRHFKLRSLSISNPSGETTNVEREMLITQDQLRKAHLILYDSNGAVFWSFLTMILVLWQSFYIPFMISFNPDMTYSLEMFENFW